MDQEEFSFSRLYKEVWCFCGFDFEHDLQENDKMIHNKIFGNRQALSAVNNFIVNIEVKDLVKLYILRCSILDLKILKIIGIYEFNLDLSMAKR